MGVRNGMILDMPVHVAGEPSGDITPQTLATDAVHFMIGGNMSQELLSQDILNGIDDIDDVDDNFDDDFDNENELTDEDALDAFKRLYDDIDKNNWLFVGVINPEMIRIAIEAISEKINSRIITRTIIIK